MGKWLRVDAICRQHPKMIAAGFWGSTVAMSCWEIAKAFDCPNGDITAYFNDSYICRWLGITHGTEECADVRGGMLAAISAGLVDCSDDGRVLIHDWDEHQPETSSERVRKYRNSRNNETVSPVTRNACNVSPVSCNAETTHAPTHPRDKQDTRDSETSPRVSSSKRTKEPKEPDPVNRLLSCYHDTMLELHGVKPALSWNGAARNTAKQLLDTYGLDHASRIVGAYLRLPDAKLRSEGYPWPLLPSRAAGLAMAMRRDEPETREEALATGAEMGIEVR